MKINTTTKIYLSKESDVSEAIEYIEDTFHVKAFHLTNQFMDSWNKWKEVTTQKLYIEVTKIVGGYNLITKVEPCNNY